MDWLREKAADVVRPPAVHSFEPPHKPFATTLSSPVLTREGIVPPMTSSSRRFSFGSLGSSQHKTIKYGKGKYSDVELVPQPSDDADDPLNWPRWRKDLNLASLLVMVGLIGGMKTAFITTNGTMASHYNVPYTAVAALTAVPLMISTFTGFASTIAAKVWGKRPLYLISALLVFIGSIWNMTAGDSYGSCMGARVFQGLGWGAFDTLVMGSVQDTYFEHERNLRVSIYNIFNIATTWGSPLLGGAASSNANSFTIQFRVINTFYLLAIPLLLLGAPETAFDRASVTVIPTPASGRPWRPWRLRHRLNKENAIKYLQEMSSFGFRGPKTLAAALQAPRALVAPTTGLVFLLSLIPYCALWGVTASLGVLVVPEPLALRPSTIGTLMVGPWILSSLIVAGLCFYRGFHQKFTARITQLIVGLGTSLVLIGLLSFGLGVHNFLQDAPFGSPATFISSAPSQLSLPLISFQLGVLAGGTYVLDAATRPLLARSASFTSSSMAVAQRTIGDMQSGVVALRNLSAGIFIMVLPGSVGVFGGLRDLVIGLSVAQVVLAVGIVALWAWRDESVWRADGRVMGLVDLSVLKQSVSFFDPD